MQRTARQAPGGMNFHLLNRENVRDLIFDDDGDYAAFDFYARGQSQELTTG